jgi:O-antigen biosynthesis protein WbqP
MIISALRNIICLIGLLLILPLICIAAFAVFIEDGLPLFFKQERLGLNQKIFTIYKVRTLKIDAPQVGTHELKDSNKLKIGKIIRAIKLDEFPQLYNVIKGDINLIGPRPGLRSQTELEYVRLANGVDKIKPGITGLAQILGYDMSNPELLTKIDLLYIQNKSFKIKLIILMGTFFNFPRTYLASKFNISNLKNVQ